MAISAWALLATAIFFEIVATSLLKASAGFTRPAYGLGAMVCYALCFWPLALAITRIPVGVAYAIWSGAGIVAIALIGWVVYRQSLSAAQIGFIALILVGAVGLNITTARAEAAAASTRAD